MSFENEIRCSSIYISPSKPICPHKIVNKKLKEDQPPLFSLTTCKYKNYIKKKPKMGDAMLMVLLYLSTRGSYKLKRCYELCMQYALVGSKSSKTDQRLKMCRKIK
jgi:hypothetical protein